MTSQKPSTKFRTKLRSLNKKHCKLNDESHDLVRALSAELRKVFPDGHAVRIPKGAVCAGLISGGESVLAGPKAGCAYIVQVRSDLFGRLEFLDEYDNEWLEDDFVCRLQLAEAMRIVLNLYDNHRGTKPLFFQSPKPKGEPTNEQH